MKHLILIAIALAFIGAQAPDPEYDRDGHLKTEHQIPAGHYCLQARVYEENQRRMSPDKRAQSTAHPCDCTYTCHVDANGQVMENGGEKSTKCKSFCEVDERHCTCHIEEPCDLGAGQARFDMHHQMVAMARRH